MRTPSSLMSHSIERGVSDLPGIRPATRDLTLAALAARLRASVLTDWRGSRFYVGALVVVALSMLMVAAIYRNQPVPVIGGDTGSYLRVTQRILTRGQFMDSHRAPGYPALIAVIFAVVGQGNLVAVELAQAGLWLLTVLEMYTLAYLVLRRSWMACAIGLLIGSNVTLLTYVIAPILSEGLTLFLVVTLALALTVFIHTLRVRDLWLLAACALLLYLTRLEWVYLAAPLFGFVLFVAAQRGRLRALLPHALGAIVALYVLVGVYILANGAQTGYQGLTEVQNLNLLGKVMQYHMQNEAPPQYAAQASIVNSYVAAGDFRIWDLIQDHPEFTVNHGALAGAYASAVVKAHPVEFVAHTMPLLWTTLAPYYEEHPLNATGPLARPLGVVDRLFRGVHQTEVFFPVLALLCAAVLAWRRTRRLVAVQAMGGVILLAVYDLLMTSLGSNDEYPRLHIPFEPLMLLAIWGSVLAGAYIAYLRWLHPGLRATR